MASTAPIGSVRDVTPNRQIQLSSGVTSPSRQVVGIDAAISPFTPVPGGIHVCTPTAARQFTITDASVPLPYDLKVGEGFMFWIQNVSGGANTITVAVAGNVTAGAGTFTIAQANTRQFCLTRVSDTAHVLLTFGTLAH